MPRPRRVRVRSTSHYNKYKLADETEVVPLESHDEMVRRRIELHPPLLAWIARARMRRALAG